MKVTVLIEHYYEHRSDNRDLSIAEYLSMHYLHDGSGHPGHDRDMQLPFKHSSPVTFAFSYFEHRGIHIPARTSAISNIESLSLYRSPHQDKEALSKIWQPPRC